MSLVRYAKFIGKHPREVLLLKGLPCVWSRCTFCDYIDDNTTDQAVKWGEATSEEMCFNLLTYYPRIDLPQFIGPAASYVSKCKMVP